MNSDSISNLSPEPINPMTNGPTNKQTEQKNGLPVLAIVAIAVVLIPIAVVILLVVGVIGSAANFYNNNDDFQAYLEKRYGASEGFSYQSDGNVYMGHREKIYYASRTKKSFTIFDASNGFDDNYWSEAYGADVNSYLEDVLSDAMPYKLSVTSEGKLGGDSAIPDSTEAILKSGGMAIDVVAGLDCIQTGNFYCHDMEEGGVDTELLSDSIRDVLRKKGINSVQSIELEISNYSNNSDDCPEGTTISSRKCVVNIYSR